MCQLKLEGESLNILDMCMKEGDSRLQGERCPRCHRRGGFVRRWVWNSSHLRGSYYEYFRHRDRSEHLIRRLPNPDPETGADLGTVLPSEIPKTILRNL